MKEMVAEVLQVVLRVPQDQEGRYSPVYGCGGGGGGSVYHRHEPPQGGGGDEPPPDHHSSHETRGAMADGVLQAVEAFRRRPLP